MVTLPLDRMPEAEVALRLAFYLLGQPTSAGHADVAVDGASVLVSQAEIFPISKFMIEGQWRLTAQSGKNAWHGLYSRGAQTLRLHSQSGIGDVVASVGSIRFRAECKKGPLVKKDGSPEYRLMRETIGQLMTVEEVAEGDRLVVAVPLTDRFRRLALQWAVRPLIAKAKINFALVGRDGKVEGLDPCLQEVLAVWC
jgi:hypothetical protein